MIVSESIDWAELRSKLPFEKTEQQKAKRKKLFTKFDEGGSEVSEFKLSNEILSKTECREGVRNVLQLGRIITEAPML